MKSMLILCILLGSMQVAFSKIVEMDIPWSKLQKNNFYYLAKFKYYPGGTLKYEFGPDRHVENPSGTIYPFSLGLFFSEDYHQAEKLGSCQEKLAKASAVYPITWNFTRIINNVMVNPKNQDPGYVIFVLMDCESQAKMIPTKSARPKVILDMRNGGEHYEAGDESLITSYTLFAFAFLAVFGFMAKDFYREMSKKSADETNYAYLIVNTCVLLKIASLVFDIIDLYAMSKDGLGFIFLNFISQSANHISQYLLTILLIFLACGWTITINSLDEFELFLPISVLIGIFKVIIIGLGRIQDGSATVFHRYDSFVGWILVAFQIILYGYFIINAVEMLKNSKKNKDYFNFYLSLATFGTIYFLIFPILMAGSHLIAPERRNRLIELGRIISQLVALSYMAYTTGHKKGVYKRVLNFEAELPSVRGE